LNLWSVIPAQNEEQTIVHVIHSCVLAGSDYVLVISNGSKDRTAKLAKDYPSKRVFVYNVEEPLGLDIPRALGAYIAHCLGADAILFCDGDLSGNIVTLLASLFGSMTWRYDVSLSNCYPKGLPGTGMAGQVVAARLRFNEQIGRKDLGAAVMSHGPSCISRKFLDTLPCHVLGIPPLAQALAVKKGLKVNVGATIGHSQLGSKERHGDHPDKIADLIIADCLLAELVFKGQFPLRYKDKKPHVGFDRCRRWDLLNRHIELIRSKGSDSTFTLE